MLKDRLDTSTFFFFLNGVTSLAISRTLECTGLSGKRSPALQHANTLGGPGQQHPPPHPSCFYTFRSCKKIQRLQISYFETTLTTFTNNTQHLKTVLLRVINNSKYEPSKQCLEIQGKKISNFLTPLPPPKKIKPL